MAVYEHECFIPLESNVTLWRYLDLEKFKSLLETKSLFFCRVDKFSDPFEGSLPAREVDYRIKAEKMVSERIGRKFNEQQALKNIEGLQSLHQRLKQTTIVNCWHINQNESDAMWRLYLKDNEGVAIQSNTKRIYATIEKIYEKIGVSKVRYIDYDTDSWHHYIDYPHKVYNLYIPLIHKRNEFKHESEFRLLVDVDEAVNDENYWANQPNHKGKLIPLDIVNLIEKIYLPPTVDEKFAFLIQQLSKDLGYNFEFIRSKLSLQPRY